MKNYTLTTWLCVLFIGIILLQSCIKDTCERYQQYSYFVPVYKTKATVRANIKSGLPVAITNPGKIFIIGNYIFLNEVDKGIHIIDNANPAAPKNIAFITIPGNQDIAVSGTTLYADMYTDMVTLDIADPLKVVVSKIITNIFPNRYWGGGGYVADTSLMVADFIKRDTSVLVSCQNNYVLSASPDVYFQSNVPGANSAATTSSANGIGGSMARFALVNSWLYTVSDRALDVFNITLPQNPIYVKNIAISSFNVETIFPFKNKLFIGSSNGMFIYSIANADAPVLQGQFAHVRTCDPVIADDNFAYVTLRSGTSCGGFTNQMDVLNIADINNPTLVRSYPLTNPHGLSKDKNLLFICDGTEGVKVFNATDANNILQINKITGIETYDVITNNNIALVVAKNGLYQYNYTDVNNIQLLSKITIEK